MRSSCLSEVSIQMNEIRNKYQELDWKGFTLAFLMLFGFVVYEIFTYLIDSDFESWLFIFFLLWYLAC